MNADPAKPPLFKTDLALGAALVAGALVVGCVGNLFRSPPLAWSHVDKAERLAQSVKALQATAPSTATADASAPAATATPAPPHGSRVQVRVAAADHTPSAAPAVVPASTAPVATAAAGASIAPERLPDLDLNAFEVFVREKHGLVIDARAEAFFREGHVGGALNLPREKLAALFPAVRARIEEAVRLAGERGVVGPRVVVYCSGETCPDAALVRDALTQLGITHVAVFPGGWEDWVVADLPVEVVP